MDLDHLESFFEFFGVMVVCSDMHVRDRVDGERLVFEFDLLGKERLVYWYADKLPPCQELRTF